MLRVEWRPVLGSRSVALTVSRAELSLLAVPAMVPAGLLPEDEEDFSGGRSGDFSAGGIGYDVREIDPLRVGGEEDPANDSACCCAWCFLAGIPPSGIDTSTSICELSLVHCATPPDAEDAEVPGNAPVVDSAGVDACDACSACCAAPPGEPLRGTVVAEDEGVRVRLAIPSHAGGVLPGGFGSGAMLLAPGQVLGRVGACALSSEVSSLC